MHDLILTFIIVSGFIFLLELIWFINLKYETRKYILKRKDCNDCNIVEVFKETMSLVLELLNNNEVEEAKEIMCDFLEEKE